MNAALSNSYVLEITWILGLFKYLVSKHG